MSELFKLKNGTVLISTEAPGGIYNSAQLKKIAELCSKELAIVKATEDQRLSLFVKESEVERVTQELKTTGLGFRNYQSGLHQPVSCLGELCETHDQPALTTAMDLTKLLADLKLQSPLKIGINGCARCCTPCHTLDVSVIGEPSGYRISLGGKPSQFPELASFFAESVPAEKLPKLLANVLSIFQSKAEPGESLSEVLDRCGVEDFIAALAPYSQDAAHRDDPFAVPEEGQGNGTHDQFGELESETMDLEMEGSNDDSFDAPSGVTEAITDLSPATDEMMELEFEETALGDSEAMDYELSSQDGEGGDSLEEVPINTDQSQVLDGDIVLGDSDLLDDGEILMDTIDAVPELEADPLSDGGNPGSGDGDADTLDEFSDAPVLLDDGDADLALGAAGNTDEVLDDISDAPELLPPALLDDADADLEQVDAGDMDEVLDDISGAPELLPPALLDDGDGDLAPGDAGGMDEVLDDVSDAPAALPPPLLDDEDNVSLDTEAREVSAALKADLEPHLNESPEEEMLELEFEDDAPIAASGPVASFDDSPLVDDEDLSIVSEELELSLEDEGTLEADVPQLSEESAEIPELDEDLLLEGDLEVSAASSLELEEGEAEGALMSNEDENDFENKIQASIEEDKKMREHLEEDTNRSAREDTLRMLENAAEDRSREVPSTVPFNAAPTAIGPRTTPKPSKGFDFEGIDVTEGIMRVYFSSGAYLDFDLSTLEASRKKVLRMGKQAIAVTHESEGYTLEVDGMRMFYPKEHLRAAS